MSANKQCGRCKELFPMTAYFFYRKKTVGPEGSLSGWSLRCRSCEKEYKKEFWNKNKERLLVDHKKHYEINAEYYRQFQAEKRLKNSKNPEKILLRRANQALSGLSAYVHKRMSGWKRSAKSRGLEFSLTREEIIGLYNKQDGKCFFSGRAIILAPNHRDTFSLDRKDPSIGYTKDNTVLCSTIVNKVKHDLTVDEFLALCKEVLAYKGLNHGCV